MTSFIQWFWYCFMLLSVPIHCEFVSRISVCIFCDFSDLSVIIAVFIPFLEAGVLDYGFSCGAGLTFSLGFRKCCLHACCF